MRYHARNIFSHVHFATCLQIAVVDLDGGRLFQKLIVREGTDGLKQLRDIISPPLTIHLSEHVSAKYFSSTFRIFIHVSFCKSATFRIQLQVNLLYCSWSNQEKM